MGEGSARSRSVNGAVVAPSGFYGFKFEAWMKKHIVKKHIVIFAAGLALSLALFLFSWLRSSWQEFYTLDAVTKCFIAIEESIDDEGRREALKKEIANVLDDGRVSRQELGEFWSSF